MRYSVYPLYGAQQVRTILLVRNNSFSQSWLEQSYGERD
jgi:hypothetical protein